MKNIIEKQINYKEVLPGKNLKGDILFHKF